jgi:hypothetical protein
MAKDKKIITRLKTELEEAKKQAEEYLNGWKRVKADYINREKEIAKKREEWAKFANQSLILEILRSNCWRTEKGGRCRRSISWLQNARKSNQTSQSYSKINKRSKLINLLTY